MSRVMPSAARRRVAAVLAVLAAAGTLAAAPPPAAAATASFSLGWAVQADQTFGTYRTDRFGSPHNAFSSPAVGDVTGDGVLDIVVGAPDGRLYVYRATDGARLNRITVGAGNITSSPSLTDLNDDGRLDIVVGIMPENESAAAGQRTIGGFDAVTGAVLFSQRTCTYPNKACNVFSTIAVGDLDGDGDDDLVATSQDHYLHAWRDDGRYLPGFPILVYDTTWSSPSLADLDGDGTVEIVAIVDLDSAVCNGNPGYCSPGQYGSMVWVVESNGQVSDRRYIPGEITFSSPAIADVTGDGRPEIAFTSGACFRFTTGSCGSTRAGSGGAERRFTVLDRNLDLVYQRDLLNSSVNSPTIVRTGSGGRIAVADDEGWLYLFDGAGNQVWNPVCNRNSTTACRTGVVGNQANSGTGVAPVAADVDNDGSVEIVHQAESALRVFDQATGAVEWQYQMWGNPYRMGNQVSTPTVFSMTAAGAPGGTARIAYHVVVDANQNVIRDGADRDGVYLFNGTTPLGAAPWPAFRGNAADRHGSVGRLPVIDVPNTPEGRFIRKAYADLLGRRTVDEATQRAWYPFVIQNGRAAFARQLVFASSCEWPQKVVIDLYRTILGRAPSPSDAGVRFWTAEICQRRRLARDVAALFYGLPEYYNRPAPNGGGGTPGGYVDAIYEDILGRTPDRAGRNYWIGQVQSRGSVAVAQDFYQSQESREFRVRNLYVFLLGRGPDRAGLLHWAGQLLRVDDLELAISLVSSPEYFSTPCNPTRCA